MRSRLIGAAFFACLLFAANLGAATINFSAISGTSGTASDSDNFHFTTTNNSLTDPISVRTGTTYTGWGGTSTTGHTTGTTYGSTATSYATQQVTMVLDNTLSTGFTVSGAVLNLAVSTAFDGLSKTAGTCTDYTTTISGFSTNEWGGTKSCTSDFTRSPTGAVSSTSGTDTVQLVKVKIGTTEYTFTTPITVTSSLSTVDLLSYDPTLAAALAAGNDIELTWQITSASRTIGVTGYTGSYGGTGADGGYGVNPCSNCTMNYTFTGSVTSTFSTSSLDLTYSSPASVPEPASLAMIGLGLVALPLLRRRCK